jgi:hypothetical protein
MKTTKKIDTNYKLEQTGNIVKISKDGKQEAMAVLGITYALEAIFVIEKYTKEDWLIYEDEKVFLICREEYRVPEFSEDQI